jgi:hypothetical protein
MKSKNPCMKVYKKLTKYLKIDTIIFFSIFFTAFLSCGYIWDSVRFCGNLLGGYYGYLVVPIFGIFMLYKTLSTNNPLRNTSIFLVLFLLFLFMATFSINIGF